MQHIQSLRTRFQRFAHVPVRETLVGGSGVATSTRRIDDASRRTRRNPEELNVDHLNDAGLLSAGHAG